METSLTRTVGPIPGSGICTPLQYFPKGREGGGDQQTQLEFQGLWFCKVQLMLSGWGPIRTFISFIPFPVLELSESYYRELRNHFFGLKYLNSLMRIRDPGWEKIGSGMEKIRIRDKHPGSATLVLPGYPSGSLGRRSLSGRLLRKGPRPGGRTSANWDADRGRETLPARPFCVKLNKYFLKLIF
jgi:hypothetical protein